MSNFKQPSLFISHGTIYEAFISEKLKSDFSVIRQKYLDVTPSAVVLFSGHWQTDWITVTASEQMLSFDEGFPAEFTANYSAPGNPQLADRIVEMLMHTGIKVQKEHNRGIDHGALIALLLLFPNESIPVLQISQQANLDPVYHKKIAKTLTPLREENILFIGSGGLVHNRNEIQKFGGHEIVPDYWAREFDQFVTDELTLNNEGDLAQKMIDAYRHPLFLKSHPTSEHFLPVVFSSAMGTKCTKIYEAFQWKNLSMSAFRFD